MRAVLADTGPLYALALPSDQYHERAREGEARLAREGLRVFVSYTTLFETQSLLLRRVTPVAAARWQQQLAYGSSLITPKSKDFEGAAEKTRRFPDQTLSYFDSLLAVLSERLELPVWAFDSGFDVMGAQVWR